MNTNHSQVFTVVSDVVAFAATPGAFEVLTSTAMHTVITNMRDTDTYAMEVMFSSRRETWMSTNPTTAKIIAYTEDIQPVPREAKVTS